MKCVLHMCGGEVSASELPLGIGYLMSNVVGHELSYSRNLQDLYDQDIVGLSTNAWGLGEAIDIAKKLAKKSPRTQIVLGGQGALWPKLDRPADYGITYVVRGDGEWALQDVLDGKECPYSVVQKRIEDINAIHFPVRQGLFRMVPIITSRGCPFHCRFCSSRAQWGTPRLRSVPNIVCEIKRLVVDIPQMQQLYILDDLWAYPSSRFKQFYVWWMKKGLNKRYSLRGFVRSNMVTMDLLKKMKRMGFQSVRFGAESGSDRMLDIIGKGAKVEDHQRAIDLAKQVGLPISASFMHGLPEETPNDLAMTRAFIEKNKGKLRVEGWYKFRAFPGCEFYKGEDPLTVDMRVRK